MRTRFSADNFWAVSRHGEIDPAAFLGFCEEKKMESTGAEEGQVIACHTFEVWNEKIKIGNENKKLVVVDFTASWCGPCRFIVLLFAKLAKKFPNVTFLNVDVDELKSVAQDWGVEVMPTFIFLKEGKIVDKVLGEKKDKLQQTINKHLKPVTA